MKAFSLYICDRSKTLLFHRDWSTNARDEAAAQNRFITLYGLFYQMKLFATAADPTKPVGKEEGHKTDGMRPTVIGEGTGFRSLSTSTYQLSFLEVPSGLKIILTTSPQAGALRQLLQRFYAELYVALVAKDPTQQPGAPIRSAAFEEEVDAFFQRHSFL